jgi:hypothetical protein
MIITLKRTCFACPEQYDACAEDGSIIGYLRLRHGRFTVQCPDVGGEVVYQANPKGDGIFTDEERSEYLNQAVEAIGKWLKKEVDATWIDDEFDDEWGMK